MRIPLFLIACLALVLSMGLGSVVHAMEVPACSESVEDAQIHSEGDADQVPADGEKRFPHHHGTCHGHHVVAGVESADGLHFADRGSERGRALVVRLAEASTDPALRPPIA